MSPAVVVLALLALTPQPSSILPAWTVDRIEDGAVVVLEGPDARTWGTLPVHALPAGTVEGARFTVRFLAGGR